MKLALLNSFRPTINSELVGQISLGELTTSFIQLYKIYIHCLFEALFLSKYS